MAYIVTVTIAGGSYAGAKDDKKISINADNISTIEDADKGNDLVGNSVIVMNNKNRHRVTETREELEKLINKK